MLLVFFFFFQAEDGIRDLTVTGVQTCALPISCRAFQRRSVGAGSIVPAAKPRWVLRARLLIGARDFRILLVQKKMFFLNSACMRLTVWNEGCAGIRKMTITIYGIKNCDTMKKARAWLDSHGVAYGFHDYKTEGVAKENLKRWSDEVGWDTLLNRAGTTFRKLPDNDKEGLNERKALALMLAQPSMIKRPVLDLGGKLLVGFKPEIYAREVAPSGRSRRG